MKLVFINEVGENWKGLNIYEFLFSDNIEDMDGEDWDVIPASGRPSPPNSELINEVGVLTTEFKFTLVQNSDTFSFWDSVDGVVSIGWEDMSGYDEYPESRLHFEYGEDIESIKDKLYEKDLILQFKK